jgi:ABC-type multidrug transport system fused ATPase/permease subunit
MKKYLKIFDVAQIEKGEKFKFCFFIFISTILEIVSIAMIIPIIGIIVNDQKIDLGSFLFFNFNTHTEDILPIFCLMIIFVFLLKFIFLFYFSYWRASFIFNINKKLSLKLFKKYINQDYLFFAYTDNSLIVRNLTSVQNFVRNIDALSGLITELIIIFGFFLVLLFYNFGATIILTFLFLTVGLIFGKIVGNLTIKIGKKSFDATQKVLQTINQSFYGIREIKLYALEEKFINFFENSVNKYSNSLITYEFIQPLSKIIFEFVAVMLIIGTIIIFNYLKFPGNEIIIFVSLLAATGFKMLPSYNKIINSLNHLKFYYPLTKMMQKELGRKIYFKKDDNKKHGNKIVFNKTIELKKINFSYKRKKILKNISLKINKFDKIGIIGETGSGKTTLINLILGLIRNDKGIYVDNLKIDNFQKNWRTKIGFVPQSVYLLNDSIEKNILFGNNSKNVKTLLQVCKVAQITEKGKSISKLLKKNVGENGSKLSGGQKQRVAIARALYNNPEMLVFDEPSSSLDDKTESLLISDLKKACKKKTMFLITHRKKMLELCNIVYKMEDGKLKRVRL